MGYSTAPGTEALDGAGDHSPYTAAFLRAAREKNQPIEQLFKRIRLDVNDSTEGTVTGENRLRGGRSSVAGRAPGL